MLPFMTIPDQGFLVNEIFDSIEGEGKRAGQLATFIRLNGCNLHCSYCDTAYAQDMPKNCKVTQVQDILNNIRCKNVTITGGEPLMHYKTLPSLLTALDNLQHQYHEVNIESNGSMPINDYLRFSNVFFTLDYKCKSSGMNGSMYLPNFEQVRTKDVIKFVVGSVEDLEEAADVYTHFFLSRLKGNVYLSPVFGKITPAEIVDFMKRPKYEKFDWRLQLQLHKYIWNPEKRGV